ncbi:E3 ubiquitin/ISG15 ligase TRIM25-like [Leptodactylus fuscus]|uniref:E3 ubiquitin/ISG15 ligase TRIM25-like n=1 Tax=Leptodactylus fuscus TaxID=238119 RepID=UPI003F4F1CD4
MASAALRQELECSICLNVYTDPVTLRCGHNFCRVCIDQHLNTQDETGVYSCPECRAKDQRRPALQKNITLCNIVENYLATQKHQDVSGIFCTYCIDSPVPAVKSCLLCEASLCDNHLRVHSKGPEHVLTDPSTNLEKRKCSVHKKILEYYCTEDAACICLSCSLEAEHRGHRIEILDEVFEKNKKKLRSVLQKLITKRKKTEERVQSLEEYWSKAQEKASGEAERVTALFTDIRRRFNDLEKKVLSEISRQEEQQSLSLSDLIQKLEIKKDELSRKMRHIEELCNLTDPLTVLQDPNTGDLCDPEEGEGDEDTGGSDKTHDVNGITGMLHAGFADLMTYLQTISKPEELRPQPPNARSLPSHIEDLPVSGTRYRSGTGDDVIVRTESVGGKVMAAGEGGIYGQGPADILLDVNTSGNNILISDDQKTATWIKIRQNRPVTAERFQYNQVISSRRFTAGRHYWDVEISGSHWWKVGMCYPSIDRRGRQSFIGDNRKSWCLYGRLLSNNMNQYSVIHNSRVIQLPPKISSNRFRICLDYEAGQLSFYELCDHIRHLHTFTATFTESLHAAVWVGEGSIKISGGAVAGRNHGCLALPAVCSLIGPIW